MGYTLNSAKDSSGQEQLYMELFNRMRPQIEQYKQQHGGDLEGAFGAIAGTPWPSGRSVKISHGQPEMTKDRTIGSVLGKWVAPIAGGALTALTLGGAAPALAGLFGGGGGGVTGGGLGTGALASGAAVPGAGMASGVGGGSMLGSLVGAGGAKGIGGSVMKNMLVKSGAGALQGGLQNGFKGALTGAASGATGALPGGIGKVLSATGQSGIGGDIMSSIMNRGQNEQFTPGQDALTQRDQVQQRQPGVRPQGW